MIESKLFGTDHSPVRRDNHEDITNIITGVLPGIHVDVNKMGRATRVTYGVNGEAFNVYYYDNKDAEIFFPEKYESIKEKLEVVGGLNFSDAKCR
jgi:hypothetical protein